jgi:hypothetical protein
MEPALAAPNVFEMLDPVRHINLLAGDSSLSQSFIKQTPGRADKRKALLIFLIPRLLADKNYLRFIRPLPKHGLGCILVKVAALARLRGGTKLLQRAVLRYEITG